MVEIELKYVIFGAAVATALFIAFVAALCFCRRHRRRRVHMEKMTIESPNPSYKTNLAGILPPIIGHDGRHHKDGYNYAGGVVLAPQQVQNGFSQVFRGSPTLPRKTFEAPPPPSSVSPYIFDLKTHSPYGGSAIGEARSVHSVIVINDDENNNARIGAKSLSPTRTTRNTVSPKSAISERLTLKNRPFQQELAESKASTTSNNAPEINMGAVSAVTLSPSVMSRRIALTQKDLLPKDSMPNGNVLKTPEKMEKLQENENEMLFYEFEILNQEAMTTIKPRTTTAELSENIRKNRAYDVLPYDFNRVKLKASESANSRMNDYINASSISTEDGTVRYIAAQSPIGVEEASDGRRSNTVADFWYMIWQEDIDVIVMLTNCLEDERHKCALYWPENAGGESITVGNDLSVDLYCITEDDISFQREMVLYKTGEPNRRIIQWQYKNWRDSTNAADAQNLLAFMDAVRSTERRSPILVHCSVGAGRTGVFIAIDILLDKLMRENVIDVFDTVARLREARTNIVQTGEQYLTIYEAIALAIRRRTTTR